MKNIIATGLLALSTVASANPLTALNQTAETLKNFTEAKHCLLTSVEQSEVDHPAYFGSSNDRTIAFDVNLAKGPAYLSYKLSASTNGGYDLVSTRDMSASINLVLKKDGIYLKTGSEESVRDWTGSIQTLTSMYDLPDGRRAIAVLVCR